MSIGKAELDMLLHSELLDLSNDIAVVFGAAGAVGTSAARRLREAGAALVLQHRGSGPREGQSSGLSEIHELPMVDAESDLSDIDGFERVFDTAEAEFGRATIVVYTVGSYTSTELARMALSTWRQSVVDNLETAFLCLRSSAERLAPGGRVVLVASISAHSPAPMQAAYNSSKAGVIELTRSAAQELGPKGIRVNSVSPGLISRPSLSEEWPEGVERWLSKAPLQRLGQPEDIANAILFLASPSSSWITGCDLVVDGGMLASSIY